MAITKKTQKNPAKSTKPRRYMLVDGHALVHRAFHAIPHLSTKSGEPTNAVFGFVTILLKAIKDLKPTHIALTFDLSGPTFRHEQYKEYKATRVRAADELYEQIPRIKEIVRALNIPVYEKAGFEADDLLGTLATKIVEHHGSPTEDKNNGDNYEVMIVTGDLDTLQLVNEHIKVYTLRKGITDTVVYDEAAVRERYGIEPKQMLDFKAIKGDPSDNIPGITGIGEKGAIDLIKEFGTVKNTYKNLDKLKEKQRALFENQKEQLEMSYDLSKIICDVPVELNLQEYEFKEIDYQKVVQLFQELEFKSLIPKLPKVEGSRDIVPEQAKTVPAKLNHNYYLIDTLEKLEELANTLSGQEEFAFDTETEGLGAVEFDFVGASFSYKEGEAYYVPAKLLIETKFDGLVKVFADSKIRKIAHNIKYDYLVMKRFGVEVKNLWFDTMIASYLLAPGSRTHDLDTLAFNEFGYQMQPIEELIGKGKNQISMKEVPDDKINFYCCEDADFTFRLKNLLEPKLVREGLDKVFHEIEMPLTKVLAEIEENGILLDRDLFAKLEKQVEKDLSGLEKKIYELAGEEFNINSPAQLKVILFEKLQISIGAAAGTIIKKTKTGYSTAASELEKMRGQHPIIDEILEYRELAKLQSTYITTLPELVSKRDSRLHTSFNQTIAATGRLSSSNPNLQNIPVGDSGYAAEIRKGFIADPGYKLVAIDYSQIELRVAAHLSRDKNMIRIFENGQDIHTQTAMEIFGLNSPEEVTKEMRRDAKTINFGVLYGVSSFGLSEQSAMDRKEAAQFIKRYYEVFEGVGEFMRGIIEKTHKNGWVANELGRKRYMPEINSSQFMVRSAAERAAINMPVQSLAADIMKTAMNEIDCQMEIQGDIIRMLLQVHDELVFEIREDRVDDYASRIKHIMENAYKLRVPLVAEVKVGDNWGDMEKKKM